MAVFGKLDLSAWIGAPWRSAEPLPAAATTTIPAPRQSLGLRLKIAADEAALALMVLRGGTPTGRDRVRIISEIETAHEFYASRGWLKNPARYHVAPPPLRSAALSPARTTGVAFDTLRFESGYEPYFGEPGRARWLNYNENQTAYAWVLRHPGPPRPWLVCIHGYRMGTPAVDIAGFRAEWLHRKLGLNVVLPVLPLHGPRRIARRSGDRFLDGDVMNAVHAEAQAMWDIRRILSWVRDQDASMVGVYGLSLGGYTAALLAALDGDLACVIAGIPATDFPRLALRHRPTLVTRSTSSALAVEDVEPVLRVVSPLALAPLVPHERRYVFGGLVDRLVPPDQVHDLWNHWGQPRMAWYEGSHLSFPWEREVNDLLREAFTTSGLVRNSRN